MSRSSVVFGYELTDHLTMYIRCVRQYTQRAAAAVKRRDANDRFYRSFSHRALGHGRFSGDGTRLLPCRRGTGREQPEARGLGVRLRGGQRPVPRVGGKRRDVPAIRFGGRSGPGGSGRLGRAGPGRWISGQADRHRVGGVRRGGAGNDCGCMWSIPERLPDMDVGAPKDVKYERGVVTSDIFGPTLRPMRIVLVSSCRYLPVKRRRVAPGRGQGRRRGLGRVRAEGHADATAPVRSPARQPAGRHDQAQPFRHRTVSADGGVAHDLADDSRRGSNRTASTSSCGGRPRCGPALARMSPCRRMRKRRPCAARPTGSSPAGRSATRTGPRRRWICRSTYNTVRDMPRPDWPLGDGSAGVLEGYSSTIRRDGSQPMRYAVRNDCTTEVAMLLAADAAVNGRPENARRAANLLDYIFDKSGLAGGPRADPQSPSFGLVGWALDHPGSYWGDDNARALLAVGAVAATAGETAVERGGGPRDPGQLSHHRRARLSAVVRGGSRTCRPKAGEPTGPAATSTTRRTCRAGFGPVTSGPTSRRGSSRC